MAGYRAGRSRSGNRSRSVNRRSGTRSVSRRPVSRRSTGRRASGSGGTKTVRLVAAVLGTAAGALLPDHLAAKAQTVLDVVLKLFVSW